jgi:FtsP/CotA-like multicopper oxidase with cupredoxin domain
MSDERFPHPLRISAAGLVLGAAAIHLSVAPAHFREYAPYGFFFVAAGAAQAALALAVLAREGRAVPLAACVVNVGLIVLWALSRTTGMPIGPHPGRPEAVGVADVACVALEAVCLAPLLLLALRRSPTRERRLGRSLAAAPAILLAGVLTLTGVGSALSAPPPMSMPAASPGGTAVTSLTEQPGSQPVRSFALTAAAAQVGGRPVWAYNGTVPGPELVVTQGDRVRVELVNHLPVATTIHWHGVEVPNAEDGVPGVTQDAVPSGGAYTYEFVVRSAGTFWYHSHQDTLQQLPRGLYGALVVEPASGRVAEDRDDTVLLHRSPSSGDLLTNGAAGLHLDAAPGQTTRLRLIDAVPPGMGGQPEVLGLLGAPYRVVALDGRDVHGPQLLGPERLTLGMGQRIDVAFTMPADRSMRLEGFASASAMTPVTVGDGPAPASENLALAPAFDPTRYGTPAPDPAAGPADAMYPIMLGAHGGFRDGRPELIHTLNGGASPDVPPIVVHEGQRVRLRFVNDTGEWHPMHLHGHTLSVLAVDGAPVEGSPVHLDTVLVAPRQTVDVAFIADNPGVWMLHCHVLLHAAFGMSMMIDYAGVSTPYLAGGPAGNVPE